MVGDLLSGWAAGLLINPLRIFFILIAAGVFGGAWIAQKVRKIAQRIVTARRTRRRGWVTNSQAPPSAARPGTNGYYSFGARPPSTRTLAELGGPQRSRRNGA